MAAAPVGFDLDMTLIDSRRAVLAAFAGVAADTGVPIDPVAVDGRLGIKLEAELAFWFPAQEIPAAVASYRQHYAAAASALTTVMPGAHAALAAVRAAGARIAVVTAKYVVPARASLAAAALTADELFTEVHGAEKAAVLTSLGARVYVGDTPADMGAARLAGATAVGVTTGSFTGGDLVAAGADVVFDSLTRFPDWFAGPK
jgi:phosphoglycolate phosphatase-like HAD superfamily hydrolase